MPATSRGTCNTAWYRSASSVAVARPKIRRADDGVAPAQGQQVLVAGDQVLRPGRQKSAQHGLVCRVAQRVIARCAFVRHHVGQQLLHVSRCQGHAQPGHQRAWRTAATAASISARPSGPWHAGIRIGKAAAQGIKTLLHAPDAGKQLGIHQRGHGLAVFVNQDAVVAVLHLVELCRPKFCLNAAALASVIMGIFSVISTILINMV